MKAAKNLYMTATVMVCAAFSFDSSGSVPIPSGSYRASCGDVAISVSGDLLIARCRRVDGNYTNSSLPHPYGCVSDIANINGNLACSYPNPSTLPQGSYLRTCTASYLEGRTLKSLCLNSSRKWVFTRLSEVYGCFGDIANINGSLTCGRR
jgi:hypothetical protein